MPSENVDVERVYILCRSVAIATVIEPFSIDQLCFVSCTFNRQLLP